MASKLFDKKFWEINKTVTKRYPEMFKALEEYDRTHKLRKDSYKKKIDLTIDSRVWNQFKAYCREKNVKMSNVVENLIKKEIS